MWEYDRQFKICIIAIPEEDGAGKVFRHNGWKFPKFGKGTNLWIEWNSKRININKTMTKHIIIKMWKLGKRKKILKEPKKKHIVGNSNVNDTELIIRSHGSQKEVLQHSSAIRKELPAQNSISSENILQEWRKKSKHSWLK